MKKRRQPLWTDGIDRCHVGFLPCHMTRHANAYHGLLVQVMDVFTQLNASPTKKYHHNQECTKAVIISATEFECDDKLNSATEIEHDDKPIKKTRK